jgi:hypothetical protein
LLEQTIWNSLAKTADRPGQAWRQYSIDALGNREFVTNDRRLFAKVYWQNGYHILRICYRQYLAKNGLWRYDGKVPRKSTGKTKPKKAPPRELLPPVEETTGIP